MEGVDRRALWGLGSLLVVTVLGLWVYTLVVAYQLGVPLWRSWHSFPPWMCVTWALYNYQTHPWIAQCLLSAIIGLIAIALIALGQQRRSVRALLRDDTLHGDARFATVHDVEAAHLVLKRAQEPTDGIVLGKIGKGTHERYVLHRSNEHAIVYAPTRAGKGIAIIIPTLLTWKESAVILDIKGELWAITSGYRKQEAKNEVMRLDFSDPSGATFNPLEEVRLGTDYELRDIANIVSALVEPDAGQAITHWERAGHGFLTGLILHAMYKTKREEQGRVPSIGEITSMLNNPELSLKELLEEMLTYPHLAESVHPEVAKKARMMIDKPDKELSSVKSTVDGYLEPFSEPLVSKVTGESSFRIADLMQRQAPVSLYIVVPPEDLKRLGPVVRILLDTITARSMVPLEFERGRSKKSYRHRMLLLLDEFPAVGRLPHFESSLAYLAGYGIQALIVTQDRSQLFARYGQEESITANCHVRVVFAPNDLKTAQWISSMCGSTTRVHMNYRTSGKRRELHLSGISKDLVHTKRALLTPEEVMRLPGAKKDAAGDVLSAGELLVFVGSNYPIRATQVLYFQDPVFKTRCRFEAPVQRKGLLWEG